MKGWLLLTVALAGAGCATTTAGAVPNGPAQRPAAANAPAEAGVAPPDSPPAEQPGVVVTASSPTNVQFSTGGGETVVPLTPVPPRTPTRRRVWVHNGMLIGAALGAIAGVVQGAAQDRRESEMGAECDSLGCGNNVLLDSLAFGAIGLGLGAAAGAVLAAFDRP